MVAIVARYTAGTPSEGMFGVSLSKSVQEAYFIHGLLSPGQQAFPAIEVAFWS